MTIVIPSWLMWAGGIVGGAALLWCLAWMALFGFIGFSVYHSLKNWTWF